MIRITGTEDPATMRLASRIVIAVQRACGENRKMPTRVIASPDDARGTLFDGQIVDLAGVEVSTSLLVRRGEFALIADAPGDESASG